jgi:4-amino-4-deoxy-L-arabinose transferase-like glycosyltransferase
MLKSRPPSSLSADRQVARKWRRPAGRGLVARNFAIAGACLLLAALLWSVHWTNIDRFGYWEDEIYSARDIGIRHISQSDPNFVLSFTELTYKNDNHPPLYFWMLARWVSVFGFSEQSGRGFSLFWLALMLIVIAVAVREWMPGKSWWVGWWAALFFGTSTYLYLLAREARMYTLALFWVSLSLLFFFRLVRESRRGEPVRASSLIGLVVAGTLGLYTHYYFAFLYLAFIAYAGCLWLARRFKLVNFGLLAGPALLFAPWIPLLLKQRERKYQSDLWVMAPEGGAGFLEGLLSDSAAALSRALFGTLFETGKVFALLALGLLLLLLLRRIRPVPGTLFGLLLLAVFSYLLLVSNDLWHGTMTAGQPKYLFGLVLPLGAALLLVVLESIPPVRFILMIVLLGYNFVGIARHWDFQPRPDWRAISGMVQERAADSPIMVPDEDYWGCLSFYLQDNSRLLNEDWLSVYPEDFWYVLVYLPWNARTQERMAELTDRFEEVERVTVDRFSILVRYRVR